MVHERFKHTGPSIKSSHNRPCLQSPTNFTQIYFRTKCMAFALTSITEEFQQPAMPTEFYKLYANISEQDALLLPLHKMTEPKYPYHGNTLIACFWNQMLALN